jgi:uncharacterized protein (DUF1697 family)
MRSERKNKIKFPILRFIPGSWSEPVLCVNPLLSLFVSCAKQREIIYQGQCLFIVFVNEYEESKVFFIFIKKTKINV